VASRKAIYDSVVLALNDSTSINYVTIDIAENAWNFKDNKFPAVRMIDGEESITRLAYPDDVTDDMESELPLEFVGYVKKNISQAATIDYLRNELMVSVESALTGSTAIDDLVKDITPQERGTDRGYSDGIGWTNGVFRVLYHYNHLNP